MNRSVNALIFIGGLFVGTILSSAVVSAWTGPSSTAPTGNVAAPINVGTLDQIKNAGLGVNSLAVYGNTILSGTNLYLNFGVTAGSGGYGIRDNAGTLEFKSTGGSWNNLTTAITNVLGIGAVTQIKFSDGTTQTTAASVPPLHNNVHTTAQCANASGIPTPIGGGDYLCKFSASSCPAGWTHLNNWGATYSGICSCGGGMVLSGAHEFLDMPTENSFNGCMVNNHNAGCYATASLVATGCY